MKVEGKDEMKEPRWAVKTAEQQVDKSVVEKVASRVE